MLSNRELEIKRMFKGKNFITPDQIKFGETEKYFYEVSSGKEPMASSTKIVYGITFIDKKTKEIIEDISHMFYSMDEVDNRISLADNWNIIQYVVMTPAVSMVVKEPVLYTNSPEACLCELKNGELTCLKGFAYFATIDESHLEKVKNKFR